MIESNDTGGLTQEHREHALTDWNPTFWVYGVTQEKSSAL